MLVKQEIDCYWMHQWKYALHQVQITRLQDALEVQKYSASGLQVSEDLHINTTDISKASQTKAIRTKLQGCMA